MLSITAYSLGLNSFFLALSLPGRILSISLRCVRLLPVFLKEVRIADIHVFFRIDQRRKHLPGRFQCGHCYRGPCQKGQLFQPCVRTSSNKSHSLHELMLICSYRSYSYQFIEACIKNKRLEDLERYLVGGKPEKGAGPVTAPRKYKRGFVLRSVEYYSEAF